MSVPTTWATELATMIEKWIGDLPHPIRGLLNGCATRDQKVDLEDGRGVDYRFST
jgi:hypothetical protein